MKISKLRLYQFRNFGQQDLELRPGLNFFVGANGQGKTNLIEAVYLLSHGESFRPAHQENFLNHHVVSADGGRILARVAASLDSELGKRVLQLDFSDRKREASLDKKRTRFSTLSAEFPIVLFSPESLASIKEGPEERRNLIDGVLRTLSEKDATLLSDFTKALRARNALLRQIHEGDRRHSTMASLESLTSLYILLATSVTEARLRVLNGLLPLWQASAIRILTGQSLASPTGTATAVANQQKNGESAAGGFDTHLEMRYEISDQIANDWSCEDIFNAISHRHRELRERELEYGSSLVGPHKHDLRFFFAGQDSRFYCSQGQQRALILAFKIAQISLHHSTTGRYPILLLDDVMSELDAEKRQRLMEYLESINAQVLITATDLTWSREFPEDRNAVFKVENGIVTVAASSAIRAFETEVR